MDEAVLERIFSLKLKLQGFKKTRRTWHRRSEDFVQVINLQKSAFGLQFYVNVALAPIGMPIQGLPTPSESQCPIRLRLDTLSGEDSATIFNIENDMGDMERTAKVEHILANVLFPFLDNISTLQEVRNACTSGPFLHGLISVDAKRYLSIDDTHPGEMSVFDA
jgi:hypothetical protein